MIVTLGIIALNEEENLRKLLNDLDNQTYDKLKTELILVDALSQDNTKQIMNEYLTFHRDEYFDIKIIDNPKKNQPSGWNLVIDNSVGEIIIRVDAHSRLRDDFIESNVRVINTGEYVCGGRKIKIAQGNSKRDKYLLMAENSIFGSSPAKYRRSDKFEYVKTVPQGCYRREVFQKIGGFDERLSRTEDNELHYRIRKAGYKICISNEIHYDYLMRGNLKEMCRQKYKNAYWIGLTSILKTPRIFSTYHFAPFLFLFSLLATFVLFSIGLAMPKFFPMIYPFISIVGLYILVDILLSIKSAVDYKMISALCVLPFLFPLLHFSYAFGMLFGLFDWATLHKYRRGKLK